MWKDFVKQKSKPEFKVIYVVMFVILFLIYEGNKSDNNSKCDDEQEPAPLRPTRVSWHANSMGAKDGVWCIDKCPRDYIFAWLKRDSSGALIVTLDMEPLVDNIVQ
uniref:Uncharacterized protein n=1 Tax=Lactuca sativa TaxID=4236 RepID=A0A9R1UGZ2_LACSA|nr:hypothetical protein LSAT_V11C900458280 [Lactuca sativa]